MDEKSVDADGRVVINEDENWIIPYNRVNFVNDKTEHVDCLNSEHDARLLKTLIQLKNVSPLSIGLFGEWGSGKSFLMRQLYGLVEEDNKSGLKEEIIQVKFNAWHYSDTNILLSMSNQIFNCITDHVNGRPSVKQQYMADRLNQLKAEKAMIEKAQRQIDDELIELKKEKAANKGNFITGTFKELKKHYGEGEFKGFFEAFPEDVDFEEYRKQWAKGFHTWGNAIKYGNGRPFWFVIACLLFFIAIFYFVSTDMGVAAPFKNALQVIGSSSFAGAVLTIWRYIKKLDKFNGFLTIINEENEVQKEIEEKEAQLAANVLTNNEKIKDIDDKIEKLADGEYIHYLMNERIVARDYESKLGVIHQLRQDMQLVNDYYTSASRESRVGKVLLYIDDLDRCPASQVVQVLEAVHLLLTFDLFVVIVSADVKWIAKCLYKHNWHNVYKNLTDKEMMMQAYNYLEKIFQITIRPPVLSKQLTKDYIESLCLMKDDDERPEVIDGVVITKRKKVTEKLYNLTLDNDEIAAIKDYVSLVESTPRRVKRFTNTYQLLKADLQVNESIDKDRDEVLLLLCLSIFFPEQTSDFFENILDCEANDADEIFNRFYSDAEKEHEGVCGFLDKMDYSKIDVDVLKENAAAVKKYSFFPRKLA